MTEANSRNPGITTELALLLTLATLWGASYTFIRVGVATIPPITLIAGRTLIAGLLLLAIMRWRGCGHADRCCDMAALSVSGLPQQRHPMDHGGLGRAHARCGPRDDPQFDRADIHVFLTLAVTRHETLTSRKLIGVVAGMVGICLIVGVQALAGFGEQLTAQIVTLLAAICYAGAAIFGRSFKGLDPMAPAAGSLMCGAAILIPLSFAVEQPWKLSPSPNSLLALLALAVFSTALAFVIYFRLIQTLGSVGTTAQAYLRVPIGVGLGVVFLGERPSATAWIGLACVVVGVAAMTIPARRVAATTSP